MLNKINTLLSSAGIEFIKEFKTTAYSFTTPTTSSTLTLPAGITEGSLGFLLIGATKGATVNAIIGLGTPTGFTLIDKVEAWNSGTGRGSSQGLYYKNMTAADSSTVISTLFTGTTASEAEVSFVEVILNKSISSIGFNTYTNVVGSTSAVASTLTDVPSIILDNRAFFLLTCATDGGGGGSAGGVFSGGMDSYDTSQTVVVSTARTVITLWRYDNVKIQDLPDTADVVYTASGTGYISSGAYIIWFK
jgi:hypothetical protein